MDFYELCGLSAEEYRDLRQRVDLCARMGHSYELGDCRLPDRCRPGRAVPGFWKQEDVYFFYFRPAVEYVGEDLTLGRFFAQQIRRFDRFEDLTRLLRSLSAEPIQLPAFGEVPRDYHGLLRIFRSRLVGQDAALEAAAFKLWGYISKTKPARPLSLIFYGPTCVGKSELAKSISSSLNQLLGEELYRTVWTELNTFTEAHSVYRLTGAPPGYAGYDDTPVLECVREHPYTVFVFDELDKAHPELLKVFMSILDEGRCTARREDEHGERELDFRRCVFLFTTNTDLSGTKPSLGFAPAEGPVFAPSNLPAGANLAQRLYQEDEAARLALARSGVLREIAGRFSGLIGFRPLDRQARERVTAKQITALGREYGLEVVETAPAIARALTPGQAVSPRSAVPMLEGILGPVFQACSRQGAALRLEGTLENPYLVPAKENR